MTEMQVETKQEVPTKIEQSIGNLLKEKKRNFHIFLQNNLVDNEKINAHSSNETKTQIKEYVDLLGKIDIDQFIHYIRKELFKYRNKTTVFIENLFIQYEIDENDIKPENVQIFKRYIEMFIEIVS